MSTTETTRCPAYDEVKHYREVAQLSDEQVWELVAEIGRLRIENQALRKERDRLFHAHSFEMVRADIAEDANDTGQLACLRCQKGTEA